MIWHSLSKRALYLAVLLLVLALPALAQVQSGNIYGSVLSGADKTPLPGVTVTLTGAGAPQVQATDTQGKFRFLGRLNRRVPVSRTHAPPVPPCET